MPVVIGWRFRGPNSSGNGGYSAGVTAVAHGAPLGPATVTLRLPPPLDTPLDVRGEPDLTTIWDEDALVAEAAGTSPPDVVVPEVSWAEASDATERFPWRHDHPYPQCFVCGTAREEGDGLRIHPGPVAGRAIAAAPWIPDPSVGDESVSPEIAWASLDCPTLFGFSCFNPWEGPLLLGRFTVTLDRLPRIGEPCITLGWLIERTGRKHYCAGALVTAEGELLGTSGALWFSVPSSDPLSAAR